MPRPHVTGRVTRSIDLHCDRGGSNKDYRITITSEGSLWRVFFEHGPAGRLNAGGEKTISPVNEAVAERIAESLKQAKLKKGYGSVADRRFAVGPASGSASPSESAPPKSAPRSKPVATTVAALTPHARAILQRVF